MPKNKSKKPIKDPDLCRACWGVGEVTDGWANFKPCFKCNGTGKKIKVCKSWVNKS